MRLRISQTVTTSLGFALAFAFLDLATSINRMPAVKLSEPVSAVALVGASFLVALIVYSAVRIAIVCWLGRRASDRGAVEIGMATVFLCTGILAPIAVPAEPLASRIAFSVLLTTACASLGFVVFRAVRSARASDSYRGFPETVTFAAPFLCMGVLGLVWTSTFAPGRTGVVLAFASGLALLPLALIRWARVRRNDIETVALAVIVIPLMVGLTGELRDARPSTLPADAGIGRRHQIPRVIVISVDTLRADSVSYAGGHVATPNIDQLARDGIVFTNAMSPAPWTLPAVVSIMTGLGPSAHTADRYNLRVPDELNTLAERLDDAGYATAAVVSNYFVGAKVNLAQGFREFHGFPKEKLGQSVGAKSLRRLFPESFREDLSTAEITTFVTRWLRENAQRDFMLWVHYYDPHEPYSPPKSFRPNPPPVERIGWHLLALGPIQLGVLQPNAEERAWIRKLYDAEVRYVDSGVGDILATLKHLGLYEEALIVFVSDHGEEFWEHGRVGHGHSLFQELLHVPLIVKLPGAAEHRTIDAVVSTSAVTPTVLDVLDVPFDGGDDATSSLVHESSDGGGSSPAKCSISEGWNFRMAIQCGALKYVHDPVGNRHQFYDLSKDPGELAAIQPPPVEQSRTFEAMLAEYQATSARQQSRPPSRADSDISPETLEALRALGYVH